MPYCSRSFLNNSGSNSPRSSCSICVSRCWISASTIVASRIGLIMGKDERPIYDRHHYVGARSARGAVQADEEGEELCQVRKKHGEVQEPCDGPEGGHQGCRLAVRGARYNVVMS